jgi:hypothetical protein
VSWTRLDDAWTDQPLLAELSFPDRWHYLAMIQFCSRTKQYDGVLRAADARRCSDHEEPAQALRNLADVGLIVPEGKGYKVVRIDDHIPPPSVRDASAKTKIRMQRARKHKNGDHSQCLPDHCPDAPAPSNVTAPVTRNTGTGRDRTGLDKATLSESEKDAAWNVGLDPSMCSSPGCDGRLTEAAMTKGQRVCNQCRAIGAGQAAHTGSTKTRA